jgi:hypothetical protein
MERIDGVLIGGVVPRDARFLNLGSAVLKSVEVLVVNCGELLSQM